MSQYVESPCKSFVAGAAIAAFLRVKISSGKLAVAGDEDTDIGYLQVATFADLDPAVVRLRSAQGTQKAVCNAAITAGALVYAAASGKLGASGTRVRGIAMETTTADGQIFEIMPL